MSIDWASSENLLKLNPRLPTESRAIYEAAWRAHVIDRFDSQIGIATSGTSGPGLGRLVLLSKRAVLVSAKAVNDRLASSASDVWLKALPDFHVGGLGILARAQLSGASVVESRREKWDASAFHEELTRAKATLASLVPAQLFDLVRSQLSPPPSLRAVILGGARLSEELRTSAVQLGWPVLPSYGMTEVGSQVATALSAADPRLVPLSHVEVRIGERERIELRSEALLTARIGLLEDGSAELEDPKRDGWFTAEDRGRLEVDGSLTILGREADFMKIAGEGVVFSRLEEKLEAAKLAAGFEFDAALLAAKDGRLGAAIVLVTTDGGEATKKLVAAFDAMVLPFERIRSVHQLAEIPRTPLGKLSRLRALAAIGFEPLSDV